MVVAIVIALAVYALLHAVVYARIAGGFGLKGSWRLGLKAVLALAALSFVAGEILGRTAWGGWLLAAGTTWLGVLAIAFAVFGLEALASLLVPRHRFAFTRVAIALVAGLSGYAWFNASRPPVLTDLTIPLRGLPAPADGFTIVQLSDLHLGRHASRDRLRGVVEQVNRLSPDLIVISGDLVDDDIPETKGLSECLRGLAATHGVLAVAGNHDYYIGYDVFERFARRSNITVLRNQRRQVGSAIEVAGIDEPAGRSFAEGGPNLDLALAGRDPALPVVLLAHRPESFERHAARGVDLQLSGHTHAGQIPPLDLLVWLLNAYSYGYREYGAAAIYTSCGTSTWGPPMRLFSHNEIVRITLVRRRPPGRFGSHRARGVPHNPARRPGGCAVTKKRSSVEPITAAATSAVPLPLIVRRLIVRTQVPEYVGAPQKRYAWVLGIALASVMFILINVMNTFSPITGLICLACLIFLFFESAFGICLGCKLYAWRYGEKAQYCPGEACEVGARQAIQQTSGAQFLIVLGFVAYIVVLAVLFNDAFAVKPHALFGR